MDHSFIFKTDRPWPNPRLREGAIVGHTTATTAKLWLRTGAPGDFELFYYPTRIRGAAAIRAALREVPCTPSALPRAVTRIPFTIADYRRDTTVVLPLSDLRPHTDYTYALYGADTGGNARVILGQDGGSDPLAYSFRTLSDDPAAPLTFGFFSCHMPYVKPALRGLGVANMGMWESFRTTLRRHRELGTLAFVIGGGDQVYVDGIDGLNIWDYLRSCLKKQAMSPATVADLEAAMASWYRDIYRGYWGFPEVKEVFSQHPTYMIWDDHELVDGWGSYVLTDDGAAKDELDQLFPRWRRSGIPYTTYRRLLGAMGAAGKRVYSEYQHSHNPDTKEGHYDYSFEASCVAVYALDGRGHRDINRRSPRILGQAQLKRFGAWLEGLDPARTPWVFVVSAVPLLHLYSAVVQYGGRLAPNYLDDLRDAWEHQLHDTERRRLIELLFRAAKRGLRVSVLSGDVHVSAAFRLTDREGHTIYQLTSSAITYHASRPLSWLLRQGVVDSGESPDGYSFKRLALFTDRNYAMVAIHPATGEADFQLYGPQTLAPPDESEAAAPITHSMVKIELRF